jgi:hypothetical protein
MSDEEEEDGVVMIATSRRTRQEFQIPAGQL